MLELIRHVNIEGYRLALWDTHRECDGVRGRFGARYVAYAFFGREGRLLCHGRDYSPAPSEAIDSDDAVRGLLSFLTLRPGDTDPEFFENDGPRMREFRETDAEELALYSFEAGDSDELPLPLVEVAS